MLDVLLIAGRLDRGDLLHIQGLATRLAARGVRVRLLCGSAGGEAVPGLILMEAPALLGGWRPSGPSGGSAGPMRSSPACYTCSTRISPTWR